MFWKEAYKHCKEAAETQLARIEEDLFLPPMENTPSSPEANGTEPSKASTPTSKLSKVPQRVIKGDSKLHFFSDKVFLLVYFFWFLVCRLEVSVDWTTIFTGESDVHVVF